MGVGATVAGEDTVMDTPLYLQLLYCFVVGAGGNKWRESKLRAMGFHYETMTAGRTAQEAKSKASEQIRHLYEEGKSETELP